MMIDPKYTYIILLLGTILVPFILSFDKKVHFYKRWRSLFPSIILPAVLFIVWDIFFTVRGVWHFSPDYTVGINLFHLPLEEWLFFLFVPYACVFVYDVIKYYWPTFNFPIIAKWISIVLIILCLLAFPIHYNKIYTLTVASVLFGVLIMQLFIPFAHTYLFRFYAAYLICLIPFGIVNGILTARPVVIYNNIENLNIRLNTIPVEDMFYFMILFLMNITLYAFFIRKAAAKTVESEKKS